MKRDVIFAPATAAGRAALAVVRLSGPDLAPWLAALFAAPPPPRRASLRRVRDVAGGTLDEALVLWFPAPGSFTGEDVLEIHAHGGPAVVAALAARLTGLGARLAEPGEFTRRAFEAGRLDLTQAEAIADLVDAETEAQRRQAVEHLAGALSGRLERWRRELLGVLSTTEAEIDFADEDLPADLRAATRRRVEALAAELEAAAADQRGEQVRSGYRAVLLGPPNAGKSSLFNALLGRDAAIVTEIAGTTRDVLEGVLILHGYKVVLLDTAGLRSGADPIEAEGVRRAIAVAAGADLRIHVRSGLDGAPAAPADGRPGDLLVATRRDLLGGPPPHGGPEVFWTAAGDPATLAPLRAAIGARAASAMASGGPPGAFRERHRLRLAEAAAALRGALEAPPDLPELAAEDLRRAVRGLESVTGRIDTEAVLGEIFAAFCIGK